MDNPKKTASGRCCFLGDSYFESLYSAFVEAFSDYVIPFALTEPQFRNHVRLTGVDLNRTAGWLDGDRIVGFSLNGFGDWYGASTVYDAGTGVIPSHRRRGLSEAMFDMMLPRFKSDGIQQCLLEVVTNNYGAIQLYEKLGFEVQRGLALLQCDKPVETKHLASGVEIRDIPGLDHEVVTRFWDGRPSWQNSLEAIERSIGRKRLIGAFADDRLVGYIVFSAGFGRVAQMAVDPAFRNRGIGSSLIRALGESTSTGYSLQVINIDKSMTDAVQFLKNRGFYERLSQYEMAKQL